MATYSFSTASGASDPNGAVSATAVITVTGDTMTVTLTDLTSNPTSDGQALDSIQFLFASAPPSVTKVASAGSLVDPTSTVWTPVSGSIDHWSTATGSGNSLFLATAGIGAGSGKPHDGIVDTAGGSSNADSSFYQHQPEIANSATFTLTFSGAPPLITGVNFGFGTAPQNAGYTEPGLVVCYLAGTRIAVSPAETVDVETLKAGDLVLTHDGRLTPVLWVGRQTVSRRFADPLRNLPIRIAAGALGENLPERDLLISRCHALLVDGLLVQAGALVNGSSITVETNTPETFVYYHVETEDHSLILAEGAPTETFIDNVDRMAFDNWNEHLALYPEGRQIEESPLPRATSARQLPAKVRSRLDERAAAIEALVAQAA